MLNPIAAVSDLCRIFIDMAPGDGTPKPGDYLVTVGKKGIGSVYQIASARAARSRPTRFHLECLRAPDMRPRASILPSGNVVMPGETVWSMRWYPRESRKAAGRKFNELAGRKA